MTSERVIKEAPMPVRYRWSALSGAPMTPLWWSVEEWEALNLPACNFVNTQDHITVELSNGQTVIVRGKK